jgi:tryptophan halogenase
MREKVEHIIVLGAGTAGFLAAAGIKTRLPNIRVTVLRAPEIKIIGVGEGSTPVLTYYLHQYLKVNPKELFEVARPLWKNGLRFIWGSSPYFNFSFSPFLTVKLPNVAREIGFFCRERHEYGDPLTLMMHHDRVFERGPGGAPRFGTAFGYHIENEALASFLEQLNRRLGVEIIDDEVLHVNQDEQGVAALRMKSGTTHAADLYVDCSGFASVLLGKALNEPFCGFGDTLFCDRAVVGNWLRDGEPIKPYTTCETMDAGWCWQIEHENRIGRGYVYSSGFISDESAEAEFRRNNPRLQNTRIVKFVSGHYRNAWVKNVIAIGNACGFVEPLEASALQVICAQSMALANTLVESNQAIRETHRKYYNQTFDRTWHSIRDFLAIHYRFNTRIDTPFWRFCNNCTPLHGAEPVVEYYQENGPSTYMGQLLLPPDDSYGLEGYYALLLGQQVSYKPSYDPTEAETSHYQRWQSDARSRALQGLTVEETLAAIRSPRWAWNSA